jgi:hypothetical protein
MSPGPFLAGHYEGMKVKNEPPMGLLFISPADHPTLHALNCSQVWERKCDASSVFLFAIFMLRRPGWTSKRLETGLTEAVLADRGGWDPGTGYQRWWPSQEGWYTRHQARRIWKVSPPPPTPPHPTPQSRSSTR